MTATERLRQLLDERGVEWGNCIGPFPQTAYNVGNVVWQVKELVAGLDVSTRYLTPEQAIAATLGAVHRKTHTKEYCNRCEGAVLPKWKKCPWCGETLEEDA